MHTAQRPTLPAALLAAATATLALASGMFLIVHAPVQPNWAIASSPPQALIGFEAALDAQSTQASCPSPVQPI